MTQSSQTYTMKVLRSEDYSGEHREWVEEYTLPESLVKRIQQDAITPAPSKIIEPAEVWREAYIAVYGCEPSHPKDDYLAAYDVIRRSIASSLGESGALHWRSIADMPDLYEQRIVLASPKLIDGDSNPEGVSTGFWQDDEGWIVNGWDMCNDEPTKVILAKEDVTHFAWAIGPFTDAEKDVGPETVLAALQPPSPTLEKGREAALREAANVGYATCAAARHVTLGDAVSEAILALASSPSDPTEAKEIECQLSPDGRHQVDTSMESGPNNCFHCEQPMRKGR